MTVTVEGSSDDFFLFVVVVFRSFFSLRVSDVGVKGVVILDGV